MSQTIEAPVAALYSFFVAVPIDLFLATYILFDAGSVLFFRFYKEQTSLYQPTNFISISNLKIPYA